MTSIHFGITSAHLHGALKEEVYMVDAQYSITGVGEVRWVLSMLLEHDRPARVISKSKEAFIDSIIARFNLTDATTLATPSSQEHTFPRSTVLPGRTKWRRWRISRIGRL